MRTPTFLVIVLLPTIALASDGVREINHACAVGPGCFAGDPPGYPVTIFSPGSYRLTGPLDLSGERGTVDGVHVRANHVSLDLGGFSIHGATSCSGSGASLSCNPGGSGVGIRVEGFAATVRNGTVRNMPGGGLRTEGGYEGLRAESLRAWQNGGDGISLSSVALVSDAHAIENEGSGINGGSSVVIRDCVSHGNLSSGIFVLGPGGVVRATVSTDNGVNGFQLVAGTRFGQDNRSDGNPSEDSCGNGLCTEGRRYYLTDTSFTGDHGADVCAPDFHMASFAELSSPAVLVYDTRLGATSASPDRGPWVDWGWVRTGLPDLFTECGESPPWSNATSSLAGTAIRMSTPIGSDTLDDPAEYSSPWALESRACDQLTRVWCIEDRAP